MALASFPGDGLPVLLGEDYFGGPGEEPWSPLAPGDEPDGWDAADEGITSPFSGLGGSDLDEVIGDERFLGVPGEAVADGGWRAAPGGCGAGWPGGRTGEPGCADAGGGFGPGGSAEVMPAGAALHALVEQAVTGGLAGMPDDAVIGVIAAARRLRSHAELLEVRATREFARRRWEPGAGPERGKDGRWLFRRRDAEFAADELAFELVESPLAAQERMDLSLALRDRLPAMDARLGNGLDLHRCRIVHEVTEALSQEHARQVDALLAPEAAGLRYGALRRRARKLAMMLDPDAERERRERATRKNARVEVFPERSGNYAIAGRELPVEEVLASRAHIRAVALDLRAGGVNGRIRELDLMVFLDLTQGRDPRDRIPATGAGSAPGASSGTGTGAPVPGQASNASGTPAAGDNPDAGDGAAGESDASGPRGGGDDHAAGPAGGSDPAHRDWRDSADLVAACLAACEADEAQADGGDEYTGSDGGTDAGGEGGPWPVSSPGPARPGGRAPFPAKINLLVPVGTLLGWSDVPGEIGRDPIDPQTLRDLVQAASHHPATRWCVTVTGADGTAAAHGCAKGQHPWTPASGTRERDILPSAQVDTGQVSVAGGHTRTAADRERDGPPLGRADSAGADRARDATSADIAHGRARPPTATQLDQRHQLLDGLKAAFEPIARGGCDHRHREDRYRPSRALQDLVRARNATCPAPGCEASSFHSDLDHTQAWPDGDTDECNLGCPCRHDHRLKQAPGWELTQPEPGFFRWKAPSGRTYRTGPTRYDI